MSEVEAAPPSADVPTDVETAPAPDVAPEEAQELEAAPAEPPQPADEAAVEAEVTPTPFFHCTECGKEFGTEMGLRGHKRWCEGRGVKDYDSEFLAVGKDGSIMSPQQQGWITRRANAVEPPPKHLSNQPLF